MTTTPIFCTPFLPNHPSPRQGPHVHLPQSIKEPHKHLFPLLPCCIHSLSLLHAFSQLYSIFFPFSHPISTVCSLTSLYLSLTIFPSSLISYFRLPHFFSFLFHLLFLFFHSFVLFSHFIIPSFLSHHLFSFFTTPLSTPLMLPSPLSTPSTATSPSLSQNISSPMLPSSSLRPPFPLPSPISPRHHSLLFFSPLSTCMPFRHSHLLLIPLPESNMFSTLTLRPTWLRGQQGAKDPDL